MMFDKKLNEYSENKFSIISGDSSNLFFFCQVDRKGFLEVDKPEFANYG